MRWPSRNPFGLPMGVFLFAGILAVSPGVHAQPEPGVLRFVTCDVLVDELSGSLVIPLVFDDPQQQPLWFVR